LKVLEKRKIEAKVNLQSNIIKFDEKFTNPKKGMGQ
jgi:hypothetical protein